jgi:hypothetical protein
MKINKRELLDRLKSAHEMEEVMAGLLTDLAGTHVLIRKISVQDRRKVRHMLSVIHADTLEHKKIVKKMIKNLSGASFGV